MRPVTPRQLDHLQAIDALTRANGYPPTIQELSKHLELSSDGGAYSQVRSLVAKGLLATLPRKSRSMHLTPKGREALAALEHVNR